MQSQAAVGKLKILPLNPTQLEPLASRKCHFPFIFSFSVFLVIFNKWNLRNYQWMSFFLKSCIWYNLHVKAMTILRSSRFPRWWEIKGTSGGSWIEIDVLLGQNCSGWEIRPDEGSRRRDSNWLCLEEHLLPPGKSDGSLCRARSTCPLSNLGVLPPILSCWEKKNSQKKDEGLDGFACIRCHRSVVPAGSSGAGLITEIPNQSCQNVWPLTGIRCWSCWFQAANQDVPASPCGVMLGMYWEEDTSWRN